MTTASLYYPPVSKPIPQAKPNLLLDRVKAISKAMFATKQTDAFEFLDHQAKPIRVERVKLAHYGYHYRVSHNNVTNVIQFTNRNERAAAQLWVVNYLRECAVAWTLVLMPSEALTFQHEYREGHSSELRVVVLGS